MAGNRPKHSRRGSGSKRSFRGGRRGRIYGRFVSRQTVGRKRSRCAAGWDCNSIRSLSTRETSLIQASLHVDRRRADERSRRRGRPFLGDNWKFSTPPQICYEDIVIVWQLCACNYRVAAYRMCVCVYATTSNSLLEQRILALFKQAVSTIAFATIFIIAYNAHWYWLRVLLQEYEQIL